MNTNRRSIARWQLLTGHLVLVTFMLGCMVFGVPMNTNNVTLHLDKDVVKVQGAGDDQTSVGGDPTFELVGEVQSTNPWKVGGVTLETRESTVIDTGLKTGDLVKVTGIVLEGKTWVALSIKLATTQTTTPTVILIGKVTSIDPWVVDGFSLNVTPETVIDDGIKVGSIVRVEITLLADGTWKVVHISLLSSAVTTSGCVTVIATIASVNGDEVQFLGWPVTITLDTHIKIENDANQENNNSQGGNQGDGEGDDQGDDEGGSNTNPQATPVAVTLTADQVVLAVLCTSDNGQIVIVQIVILNVEQEANTSSDNGAKVLVCHKPHTKAEHTLSLPQSAVPAHLGHGDTLGACP